MAKVGAEVVGVSIEVPVGPEPPVHEFDGRPMVGGRFIEGRLTSEQATTLDRIRRAMILESIESGQGEPAMKKIDVIRRLLDDVGSGVAKSNGSQNGKAKRNGVKGERHTASQ